MRAVTLALGLLAAFATTAAASIAGTVADSPSYTGPCLLTIDIWYPTANLPTGAQMYIGGTAPFNWQNIAGPIPQVATDHWQVLLEIPTTTLNATQPTWAIAFKILANENYEMGANHRITAVYGEQFVNKTIYPYFSTTEGEQFTLKNVYSPQLNNTRDVWIFAPPAMVENPYFVAENTIIMQDGQNLAPLWGVPGHLNKLWGENDIEQLFMIGPYNTPDRIAEYTYSKSKTYGGGKGDLYLDWVQDTLVPYVSAQGFNFKTAQPNLAIGGSSLGGLISCYAGVTRPSVYSKMVCMSSSFWWNDSDFLSTIMPQLKAVNSQTQVYYADCGDSGNGDDDLQDTTVVSSAFISSGLNFILGKNFFWYMQRGGQHNEYWWSLRFHHPMQFLYQRPAVFNEPISEELLQSSGTTATGGKGDDEKKKSKQFRRRGM